MSDAAEPSMDELYWTIRAARDLFGADMSIQAPPNLSGDDFPELIDAGLNDWGGVSPVTPDHVNPEAPWPEMVRLREGTVSKGKTLAARLPVYPGYILEDGWLDDAVRPAVIRAMDSDGLARDDRWSPGTGDVTPATPAMVGGETRRVQRSLQRAVAGETLAED